MDWDFIFSFHFNFTPGNKIHVEVSIDCDSEFMKSLLAQL